MEQETHIEEKEIGSEKYWFGVYGILSLLWLLAYLPQWFVWDWMYEALGSLAALVAVLGALGWLVNAATWRSRRMLIAGLVMAVAAALVMWGVPNKLKLRVTLAANEVQYLKVIDEIRQSPDTWSDAHPKEMVYIDQTDGPLRVGFDLGNGFLDDSWAIVYDPSGEIMKVNVPGSNEKDPFEGVVGSARHLRGPWYFAIFFPDNPNR
ncbi:MAG: hypothetical protein M3R13_08675 [Armatimonadota bacterium]|nr:hypothetical protein [Armatimonadota bacterium]